MYDAAAAFLRRLRLVGVLRAAERRFLRLTGDFRAAARRFLRLTGVLRAAARFLFLGAAAFLRMLRLRLRVTFVFDLLVLRMAAPWDPALRDTPRASSGVRRPAGRRRLFEFGV